ncbi:MAG: RsmB/NOP family class I SAM-dependent RNA methyltransferase [Acidimicrobiia bacterium]
MAKRKPIDSKLNKKFIDYVNEHVENYIDPNNFLQSLNSWPEKAFRVNTHAVSIEDLCSDLKVEMSRVPWCRDASYFDYELKLGQRIEHTKGRYYIGDPSAMALVEYLDIKPDDVVVDVCAAPGGKSVHALNKLGSNGFLIANDVDPKRADILRENLYRTLNVIPENERPKYEITNLNIQELSEKYADYADVVILDAPCSGEAMMRRSYTARRQWSEKLLMKMSILQKMLFTYSKVIAKPNSKIGYSTCTFNSLENDEVVNFAINNLSCTPVKLEGKTDGLYEREHIYVLYPHFVKGDGQSFAILTT